MGDFEYYKALAERIFFNGIKNEEISSFAMYRSDKTFQDLDQDVSQGRLEGIGKFEHQIGFIAHRLYQVLEINIKAFDKIYSKPDQF